MEYKGGLSSEQSQLMLQLKQEVASMAQHFNALLTTATVCSFPINQIIYTAILSAFLIRICVSSINEQVGKTEKYRNEEDDEIEERSVSISSQSYPDLHASQMRQQLKATVSAQNLVHAGESLMNMIVALKVATH
jgi:hypothetical protein